jgi:hypothetical protein
MKINCFILSFENELTEKIVRKYLNENLEMNLQEMERKY